MKGSDNWLDKCMDLCRGSPRFCASFVVILVLLAVSSEGVQGQEDDNVTVVLYETPPPATSNTTATFRWGVVAANGSNPCAVEDCVNLCQLDGGSFQNCSGQFAVYTNLTDGAYIFTVVVSTIRGYFFSNRTSWTVDTIPPTAVLTAGASFTNAVNVNVSITFSERCTSPGFQCPNVSDCDAYVSGPGTMIPSTLIVHKFGLEYSITVALSTAVESGKVDVRMSPPRKGICFDAAGNAFVRNASSIFTVRFSRAIPTVNVWTPVQDSQLEINNEYMTISATSSSDELILYLDFSEPVVTTAAQLLNILEISHGILSPRTRRKFEHRYFAFSINNVSDSAIVSVSLPANSVYNKYTTYVVQTANITFLYDSIPPGVSLSTTSLAKTKSRFIPILIQFTKPVFFFGTENISLSGGNVTRFVELSKCTFICDVKSVEAFYLLELSKSTYTFELYIPDHDVVSVGVKENVTSDIAGNPNSPSNVLHIRHYAEPAFAVALYSFTTAGLIATALASGAISISSATLAAAGALNSQMKGSIGADPSRNLLGMATHLQVFALSEWLAVSLPVEYRETARGLRWLIPHVNPPWQKQPNSTSLNNPLLQQSVDPADPVMRLTTLPRRRLLTGADHNQTYSGSVLTHNGLYLGKHSKGWQWQAKSALQCCQRSRLLEPSTQHWTGQLISGLDRPCIRCKENERSLVFEYGQASIAAQGSPYRGRRRLGPNMTAYGPALGPDDYALYFENDTANMELRELFHRASYTGWRDFARNMFWVGVVGGGLLLFHILSLLFLRWRTKTSVRGALTVPRFELVLLILAIPCMCQASAFIIRGGTTLGIIVGVLLLAIPAAFLLSVVFFLVIAIFLGSLVQYKEVVIRHQHQQQGNEDEVRPSWRSKLFQRLAGPNTVARWVRKDGLAPTFLPRYGLFFEDRKGPPKVIVQVGEIEGSFPKWVDSGSNGVGRMRAMNSDDESEEVSVPLMEMFIGGARAAYISVDISRRIALGVIFGAFSRSDKSWIQVSIALGVTFGQLLYLIFFKPFIKRGVQVVESISLFCETGLFVTALVLLCIGHPSDDHLGPGILLLALLLLSFVSQLVNEWYALMKQLLRLSPCQEPSLKVGLKMLSRGLILPFVPRGQWGRFISPHQPLQKQPRTGLAPVVPLSPEQPELQDPEMLERARRSSNSVHTGSPLFAIGPEPAIPGYDPGSPAFIDPRNAVIEEAVVSGEIKADSSASVAAAGSVSVHRQEHINNKSNNNWGSQWSRSRSMEGKRSTTGVKTDSKSSEMKMLRDIAKASFPRWRKHEEISDPGLQISSPVPSNVGAACSGGEAVRKLSSSAPSRVGGGLGCAGEDEHGYTDDESNSDNSSDDERYHSRCRPPPVVGESSFDILGGGPSRGVTPHSSSSFEKGSRGSGPLETTLSGGSLPLREVIQER